MQNDNPSRSNYLMKIFDEIISDREKLQQDFTSCIRAGKGGLFTYFNQHCFNIYHDSSAYRDVLKYFYVYNDGVGIYYSMKFLRKKAELLNATSLNQEFLDICKDNYKAVLLISGNFNRNDVVSALRSNEINCVEYKNGFFNEADNEIVISEVKELKPPVIFIGMGVPAQELFAFKLAQHLPDSVIVCVGNFWEFYFHKVKRAPEILHDSGFEWLHRLFTEPRRLYKRYLLGIPLFIYRIIKLKFC